MKKTIRIIDLLNKISNGEEVPKRIRIDHWCYKFEWVEHLENYYDKDSDIDLMSALSMNKEELNYEVEIIDEDKKIKKLDIQSVKDNPTNMYIVNEYGNKCYMTKHSREIALKLNELIDEVNELKGKSE